MITLTILSKTLVSADRQCVYVPTAACDSYASDKLWDSILHPAGDFKIGCLLQTRVRNKEPWCPTEGGLSQVRVT